MSPRGSFRTDLGGAPRAVAKFPRPLGPLNSPARAQGDHSKQIQDMTNMPKTRSGSTSTRFALTLAI